MNQEKKVNTVKKNGYSDVYESCFICGRDMTNINRIFITIDTDQYICQVCKKKHNVYAAKCAEI
jgi:hypothetical protein